MARPALQAQAVHTMEPVGDPIDDGVVVINGAEIVGVGPSSELGRWPAATVVDTRNRTIVRGLHRCAQPSLARLRFIRCGPTSPR